MKELLKLIWKDAKASTPEEELQLLLSKAISYSGFDRELAVRNLGKRGDPASIPVLLVRANDWVPQVREAAVQALEGMLNSANAQAFIDNLPAVHHLEHCGRADHRKLIDSVTELLLREENRDLVRKAVSHANPLVARRCVRLCIAHALLPSLEIVRLCMAQSDMVVRDMGSDLIRQLGDDEVVPILQLAINDPYMPVRREAFQQCLRRNPALGLEWARERLFDRSSSIREIAIGRLKNAGTNVEGLLVASLSSASPSTQRLNAALMGLAFLKAASRIALVEPFTAHPRPSVRRAALQAMTWLDEEVARPLLLPALIDASPAVAKEAARLLSRSSSRPTLQELLWVMEKGEHEHSVIASLASSRWLNKWDRLIFLLQFLKLRANHTGGLEQAKAGLEGWDHDFNRSPTQPTAEQMAQIEDLYRRHAGLIHGSMRESLEFVFSGLGIKVKPWFN